jgi:hypothetical protein
MNLPLEINMAISNGRTVLVEERRLRSEEIRKSKQEADKKSAIRNKKLWAYLCIEAQIDLDLVRDYINWNMPKSWSKTSPATQWLKINIPNLTEIEAEYQLENRIEWTLNRYMVAAYERCNEGTKKTYIIVNTSHNLDYVLAFAAEQYEKKCVLEKTPLPKTKIEFEEEDDSCAINYNQAVS